MRLRIKIFFNCLQYLVIIAFVTCILSEVEADVKWSYKRNTTPATAVNRTTTDIMHQIGKRTSVFEPGKGRSFLATLSLFIFKIIKIACLCSFLACLFLILCPLLPLIIPALLFSLLLAISLIALLTVVPPSTVQPPPTPTVPPIPPPFTSIPARR